MKKFGLIGYPLSHSFSPDFFRKKFENENITNCQYNLYPLPQINQFPALCKKQNLNGLNVTIPYKETIIPFLDFLSPEAQTIGAVNTLQFVDKKITGHNTDTYGFKKAIAPFLRTHHDRALILGTGGSAKSVHYTLHKMGISTCFVSRSPKHKSHINYTELTTHFIAQNTLIINCSPAGMFPHEEEIPNIPIQGIGEKHLVFDLIYNPKKTRLLREAEKRGAQIENGSNMLIFQAEKAWEIWNRSKS